MIDADLTEQIIGAAIEVHKHWGPGLYEEVYERSLCHELRLRNVAFDFNVPTLKQGEKADDIMTNLLLCLPVQAVRANLRLATQTFHPDRDPCVIRQSQICAKLLSRRFFSVLPCLRGESSSVPIAGSFANNIPSGSRSTLGIKNMQFVRSQCGI